MSKQKRYVATVDFYIYADNDADAVEQATKIAKAQDTLLDDRCAVVSVVEQAPCTVGNRHVYGYNETKDVA